MIYDEDAIIPNTFHCDTKIYSAAGDFGELYQLSEQINGVKNGKMGATRTEEIYD